MLLSQGDLAGNEDFQNALYEADWKAGNLITERSVDPNDPMAGFQEDRALPTGAIIREHWWSGFETEVGDHVLQGSQRASGWFGRGAGHFLFGDSSGKTEPIVRATALLIKIPAVASQVPNFAGASALSNRVGVPVYVSRGNEAWVVNGNSAPVSVTIGRTRP